MTLSEAEKTIMDILDDLQNLVGNRYETVLRLRRADQNVVVELAKRLLEDVDSVKREQGIKSLMLTDNEKNLEIVLPMLNDSNSEVRRIAMFYIIRSEKFLENIEVINRVIKSLREDPRVEVRAEAAEGLRYCKTTPEVISALEYVSMHDYEYDDDGYSAGSVATASLQWIKENGS